MASKYKAVKTEWQGHTFDSKAECARYIRLMVLQRAGLISDLTRQVSFELIPRTTFAGKTVRATVYRADFKYVENGKTVIEDVKGMKTQVYLIKKKLMKHVHGIEIRETK